MKYNKTFLPLCALLVVLLCAKNQVTQSEAGSKLNLVQLLGVFPPLFARRLIERIIRESRLIDQVQGLES
jgi:hypothetical protein